jgi:hypothetical protein
MTNVNRSPGSQANYNNPSHPGQHPWTLNGVNGANIAANNPAGLSYDLVWSGFNFASQIPAGATIDGIAFGFIGSTDQPGILDQRVVLRVGTGPDSANRAKATTWPFSTATRNYGGAADTWGLAAANPGMTLAEIVRAANFSVALQVTNNFGDPEDFQRTFVAGASVTVSWSLPAVVKTLTSAATMSMAARPVAGIVTDLTLADGAQLNGAAQLGRRADMLARGSAALNSLGVASIASPAVTSPWRTIAITDRGDRTVTLTQPGSNEGEI